jgi:CRP-like cAMP-binding protein
LADDKGLDPVTAKAAPGRTSATLFAAVREDPALWSQCQHLFKIKDFPERTTLLREGEIARRMYFIRKGCLRLWFNKAGKDITFQFFVEGQAVSSIESFLGRTRSAFSIETIEPTSVVMVSRNDWERLFQLVPQLKDGLLELIMIRMENYAQLFLSRIRDNPRERYEALVRERPDIIQRVPQHYIASYLGITPVSLSRIRGRISRKR